jgi:histidinol-phosphatase (PHP family)
MKHKYNYHTHSHYDDGQLAMEDFVKAAIELEFDALGFSGHSPIPVSNEWSIPGHKLPEYIAEGKRLKEAYKNEIRLYLGLEIDYIPGLSDDYSIFTREIPLDYCIGSVHLVRESHSGEIWFIDGPAEGYYKGIAEVFGGDHRKAVAAYYEQSMQMVETQKPDIIGHIDKVNMHNQETLFSTAEPWYSELTDRLLEVVKRNGTIVELNTRGVYTGKTEAYFPSDDILKKCLELDIPVMVNSDAHHPTQLFSHVPEAIEKLRGIGFKQLQTPFDTYRI